MRVRMLETRRGTEDGFVLRLYEAGGIYDMADFQARCFIAEGRAIAMPETPSFYEPEQE
jgi:hypothetical protein